MQEQQQIADRPSGNLQPDANGNVWTTVVINGKSQRVKIGQIPPHGGRLQVKAHH